MNTKNIFKYLKKLPGKWLLPVIALVWVLGVGFQWISVRICIILTVLIVVGWLVYLLIKKIQARGEDQELLKADPEAIPDFEKRVAKAVKSSKGNSWYMLLGPLDSGKTSLLRNSNLDFSFIDSLQEKPIRQDIEETKNCDLFFTNSSTIIDTSGRYVNFGNEVKEKSEWLALMSILRKYRKEKPLDGILITVDVDSLLGYTEEEREKIARSIRNRISEIINKLKTTFPIYLIFTKSDMIYGFSRFFDDLEDADRSQVWGATLKAQKIEKPEVSFMAECESLFNNLKNKQFQKLASSDREDRGTVYSFPMEFYYTCQKLSPFVKDVLSIQSEEKPIFRGFYFTSATQNENSPVELVLKEMAESFEDEPPILTKKTDTEKKSYFIKDVFQKVVFPDSGYIKPLTEAVRHGNILRLVSSAFILAVFVILGILITVSYVQNKKLMADTRNAAMPLSKGTENISSIQFENLRKHIIQLEKSDIFNVIWQKQRNMVAGAARKLYLTEKYGDNNSWEVKLSRNVKIPIRVIKSEKGNLEPIRDAEIKAVVDGREYIVKTDERGSADLNLEVQDGRTDVVLSTDHQESGYEPQTEKVYQIKPGETVSTNGVEFLFSEMGRVVNVHITDQSGQDLMGVPISIIEVKDESKKYGPEITNEQGVVQLRIEAPKETELLVYYGDSPKSYPAEQPDTVVIESGKSRYSLERQLRRKISISVVAFEESRPKPGVSISVEGEKLGVTGPDGQWSGAGDEIPTEQNVSVRPEPALLKVEETVNGYSVVLEYTPKEPAPVLEVTDNSGMILNDVEVWVYNPESIKSIDEMNFNSEGKVYKLVQIDADDSQKSLEIPKKAKSHKLLLYNKNYWPQVIEPDQIDKPIKMVDIDEERSLESFEKYRRDGAEHYYEEAERYHSQSKLEEAAESCHNAIRLTPRLKHYLKLAWIYYEDGKADEALAVVDTGLNVKLTGDTEADEQLLRQQLLELKNLFE
ncbi:hypothetical protein GF312_15710 [Candidatus Poribacteria bacterium]|nr:hypothetical protein [Candidatus Poribacteria bacterium]